MDRSQLAARWLPRLDALEMSRGGSPVETAEHNRTSFPLKEARDLRATDHDLAGFLARAFGSYCRGAARIGLEGWFYAWCDELAGTLNCSACDVPTPEDLPFECRLDVRSDAEAVAHLAMRSPYLSGIPARELKDVEWTDPDADQTEFVLLVYAKRLLVNVADGSVPDR